MRDPLLPAIASASLLALVAFTVDHPLAAAAGTLAVFGFPPALIALGAARRGTLGRLRVPLAAFAFELEAVGLALVLAPGGGEPGWFGLPAKTVLMLLGLGVVPLVVVPWLYAWDFDREDGSGGRGSR
ncbi:MAG: hypothetical protein D6718_05365 [Acidobacteria bacterium]|nr:MAG: hypothetical protein D6718_05365 [Acidobacteriota bacterium]